MNAIDRLRKLGLKLPKTEHALASAEARRVLVVAITTEAINELLAALVEQAEERRELQEGIHAVVMELNETTTKYNREKTRADEADSLLEKTTEYMGELVEETERQKARADEAEANCEVQFKGAAKVQRIRAERAEAKNARLEEWIDDLQSGMYINCVYCGHRYGPDDEVGGQTMRQALEDHIAVCSRHPLALARQENQSLRSMLISGTTEGSTLLARYDNKEE